jgi:putative FmdB family regulatory protein
MPIYEYNCSDCGHQFESLVRSNDVPQCPNCQSNHLEKLLSVFSTATPSPQAALPPSPCGACPNANGPGGCAFG